MKDYSNYSVDQLIARIEELEMLNHELLKEKEQETKLEFAWSGNLGHWYWDLVTNTVTFDPLKIMALGYKKEEIPENVTYQFFTERLHPDDYEKTMQAMKNHLYGNSDVYEVEYRIRTNTDEYKWYYDRGRITRYSEDGKPIFIAGIVFDITEKKNSQLELEQKNKLLSELSSIDGLTRICNHRTLIEFLESCMRDADQNQSALSIVLFDIDDFKKVNDTKGHVYGDYVLVEIASMIKECIRESDLVGRYGGEEFMVVFQNTVQDQAIIISDRIRKKIADMIFAQDMTITMSGGVTQYFGESSQELIDQADRNLYEAKRKGKNRIEPDREN